MWIIYHWPCSFVVMQVWFVKTLYILYISWNFVEQVVTHHDPVLTQLADDEKAVTYKFPSSKSWRDNVLPLHISASNGFFPQQSVCSRTVFFSIHQTKKSANMEQKSLKRSKNIKFKQKFNIYSSVTTGETTEPVCYGRKRRKGPCGEIFFNSVI